MKKTQELSKEFSASRVLSSNISKPVFHCYLYFADYDKLSNVQMVVIGEEY